MGGEPKTSVSEQALPSSGVVEQPVGIPKQSQLHTTPEHTSPVNAEVKDQRPFSQSEDRKKREDSIKQRIKQRALSRSKSLIPGSIRDNIADEKEKFVSMKSLLRSRRQLPVNESSPPDAKVAQSPKVAATGNKKEMARTASRGRFQKLLP